MPCVTRFPALICLLMLLSLTRPGLAVPLVNWTAPTDGSSFPVDTSLSPTGIASAIGTTGDGLDLALVLDSSASMTALVTVNGVTQTRAQWQKDAAISLINNLPATQVAVAIVEFDYYADLVRQLSPVFTDEEGILSAIASVDASGSTYIGKGIDVATQELIGGNHTSGWTQQMIVFSDGYTTGVPADNAAAALTAGVDAVHSVALPGADLTTMLAVALAGHGTLVDATTPTGLAELIDRFAGLGESLVGIDRIDITLPDGTLLQDIASDSLGHFRTPEWLMQPGPNAFLATAYDYAGLSVSAPLTLHGTSAASEPGVLGLLALSLIGLLAVRRPGVQ